MDILTLVAADETQLTERCGEDFNTANYSEETFLSWLREVCICASSKSFAMVLRVIYLLNF